MKKSIVFCAGLCMALAFASCNKSSESAYKKAYERSKSNEAATVVEQQPTTQTPVVTPLTPAPSTQTQVTDNYDNVSVRTENVQLVSGSGLKAYSVVVGAFSVKANAEGLYRTLKNAGYDAQVAYNASRNMYRVIASTYADKGSAVRSRDQLRDQYPDAWLLYNK